MVVLDTLAPAERLAFVLHDIFAVPFDDIAPILERSPVATRQLASRARRRVQGATPPRQVDLGPPAAGGRRVPGRAAATVTSTRWWPCSTPRSCSATTAPGYRAVPRPCAERTRWAPTRSGSRVAPGSSARRWWTGARAWPSARADGCIGALGFTFDGDTITAIDMISDRARLRHVDLAAPGQ